MSEREEIDDLRREVSRLRRVITELTPDLASLLRQRGFTIYKSEPQDDLLLYDSPAAQLFYDRMKKYSFRLFLRDAIRFQDGFTPEQVSRYASPEVTAEYIDFVLDLCLIEEHGREFRLTRRPIRSFGATLEWFVAEVFKREFRSEAIWGVKFRKIRSGGDYDVIAKINGSILYMETKSSPPKQVYAREISAFLNRINDLQPALAVFFMDTQLRMKDKIVPFFEEDLDRRYKAPPAVVRMEKELFHIDNRIFIINAQGSIAANIEKVLRWYFRSRGQSGV